MTPEGRIKVKVKFRLAELGTQCWRFMPVQTGFGTPALDIINCINGWFVAIETKKDAKSKLTDRQQATKLAMETAGGIVLVVYDDASLDRAMKVINIICKVDASGYNRKIVAEHAAEDQGEGEQHLRDQQQDKTPYTATGWHHGAPRKKSVRQPKSRASVEDQRVIAAKINPWDNSCVPCARTADCCCPACKGEVE